VKHISGQRMCRVLERHGWRLDRIRGSHHIYVHPTRPGLASVPVHGNQTLRPDTQKNIMRAAGLTDNDL
jgi:predicted RNA binding protein YcfA (HicA-like mRNA interferase family)